MHIAAATLRHPSELDLGTGLCAGHRATLRAMPNTVVKPVSNVALEGLHKTTTQGCTKYAAIRCAEILNRHPQITAQNMLGILRREAAAAATR